MKRLFYLLIGLVLLPAFLYAQGTLSLKDINDNLTNNYYNKTASDARYATTTYGYSSAEVDLLLAPKADKTYVNATDEAIISDNDSQDVQIESNRVAITLKASQTDMDSAEAKINQLDIRSESTETGLDAHIDNLLNPHQVTASQVNTGMTTEVSDTTTVLGQLIDIGQSINKQQFSGHVSWGDSGDYWQITGGAFELLRSGCGYIYGRKVNWTAPQTTGVLAANTEYYVYIDRNGVIQLTSDQTTAFNAIPLFELFYDGTNYHVVKENHPYNFPTRASEYIHNNIGIIIRNAAGGANIDKLGTGTGAAVTDIQVELLGADVLEDHGLETIIPDSTGAPITIKYFYTNGSGKWIQYLETTEVPLFYNNAGTPTALTSNYYGNYRLYVSKDNLNSTTPVYIGVMDDGNYANATLASNAITAGIPSATGELAGLELAQLGYVTVRNAGTYGHVSSIDVEKSTLNGETTGSGATNIASLISTTAFTGTLAGALNVQVALDIIDALVANDIPVDASGFTGNLSLADDTVQKALATLDALAGLPATNAITKIYGSDDVVGSDTGAVWLVGTNGVTVNRTDNTFEIEIPAVDTNQTVTVTAGEALTAGQVVSLINESGTMKAYNNALTVSTSPNGAESVFNAAATTYCSAVALDENRFLVAYQDSDTYPKAIVGTVTGSTIAWGSESAAFENVNAIFVSSCKVASDKALVVYADVTNSKGRTVVLSISTNTISVGTPVDTYTASPPYYTSLTQIDTGKALFCFQASGGTSYGKAAIITVSSTTPTYNSPVDFNEATTAYTSCSSLSTTSAIVAYRDGGNSNFGTAQILSISGTTITPGTEYLPYGNKAFSHNSITAINSTSAILVFADSAIDGYGRAVHITNNSGALIFGNVLAPKTDNNNGRMSISKIDDTHFLWALIDYTGTENGYNCILTLTGTTLSASDYYNFNASATTDYISPCYLGSNKSVISYNDVSNSNYGAAVVNTWATTSYANIAGISQGAYSSGSDAVVLISGSYDGLSSLIPGSPYFVNASFELQTTPVSLTSTIYSGAATTREIHFGTAKSSTEIVLNIDYR